MKNTLVIIICLLAFGTMNAQVMQKEAVMSLGSQNAFYINLDGADEGLAEDVWKNYLKEYGKVKKNRKADELLCEECNITLISGATLQVYLKLDEGREMTTAYAYFDNGSSFITAENDPEAAESIEKFIHNYSLEVKKEVIKEQLEDEEDTLKDFNKDLAKLEKENKKLHEEIKKAEDKIRESEEGIEKNLRAQEDKKFEIDKQAKVVEETIEKLNNVGKG